MKQSTKNSFLFTYEMYEATNQFEGQRKMELIKAICDFNLNGTQPIFNNADMKATWDSLFTK